MTAKVDYYFEGTFYSGTANFNTVLPSIPSSITSADQLYKVTLPNYSFATVTLIVVVTSTDLKITISESDTGGSALFDALWTLASSQTGFNFKLDLYEITNTTVVESHQFKGCTIKSIAPSQLLANASVTSDTGDDLFTRELTIGYTSVAIVTP